MNVKNNKGVTLVSLAVYVILMLGVIAVIASFKNNIDKTLDSMGEYTSLVPEINKMHMYMLDEVNTQDNKILKRSSDGTYIEFASGNNYMFSGDKIYKNSVRIFSDIKNCIFETGKENNNDVLYVNLQLGDKDIVTKRLKYVMKSDQGVNLDTITGVQIAKIVKVGDYVNYDAGTWTEADFNKITSSEGKPTVNKSTSLPSEQGQFGGFTVEQSRNSNSTPYSTSYTPDYSGWRVWDIDKSTGEVTLISAGHPETYYHYSNSAASTNILRNRDYSMYKNGHSYVKSVGILTKEEFDRWYKKHIDSSVDDTWYVSEFPTESEKPIITVAENGSYYWLASPYNSDLLYDVYPDNRCVSRYSGLASGVRVLVSLKSGVQVEASSGDGSVGNPWKLVQ